MRCRFPGAIRFPKRLTTLPTSTNSLKTRTCCTPNALLSSNDQRHRFVFSGTFDLPFADEEGGKKSSGVIAKLLGNIEAAPILIIGSGRPINSLTGFDTNRSGAFPLSSRPLAFGRNSLATTAQVQFDLRVLK